jgi:chaperonin GroES
VRPAIDGQEQWNATKKMNSFIRNDMDDWEGSMDSLLMVQALVGCPVKKIYHIGNEIRSELVMPDRIVVDYNSKKNPERMTHRCYYSSNDFEEAKRIGFFDEDAMPVEVERKHSASDDVSDEARGLSKSGKAEGYEILEMHCLYDLDGDGYAEPYIIHIDEASQSIVRIASRFEQIFMSKKGSDLVDGYAVELEEAGYHLAKITPEKFFIKYPFIPSPDGSWYDIGFGSLLTPINSAVDSLLNQLIDSGTLDNTQGGLVARNVRTRSGKLEIVPGKWIRTEASAQDLQKGIFPWPTKAPSTVLFNLMTFLLEAGERLGSVTEIMTGQNPGQNQAATTTMAVLEQGSQVHNSIYKRTFRAMTAEMKMIYKHLVMIDPQTYNIDPSDLELTADPSVMSASQRIMKAEALKNAVAQAGHLYGEQGEIIAERGFLNAIQINGADELLANPQPRGTDPQVEFDKAELELQVKREQRVAETENDRLEIEALRAIAAVEKSGAEIDKIYYEMDEGEGRSALEGRQQTLNEAKASADNIMRMAKGRKEMQAAPQAQPEAPQVPVEELPEALPEETPI